MDRRRQSRLKHCPTGAATGSVAAGVALILSACAAAPQLIDEQRDSGFAVYRSGRLDAGRLAELCGRGVEQIVVMDGTAADRECRLRAHLCPGLRVRYNYRQDARQPVTRDFLQAFDRWVEESRDAGRKIAFRCRHGWHRAGRLAAYYRLRYHDWNAEQAIDEMLRSGRFMQRHADLQPQVRAMADLLASRPCSQEPRHCPQPGQLAAEGLVQTDAAAEFAVDVCDPIMAQPGSR